MNNFEKYKVTEMEYPVPSLIKEQIQKEIDKLSKKLPYSVYAEEVRRLNDSYKERLTGAIAEYNVYVGQKHDQFRKDMEEFHNLSIFSEGAVQAIHAKAWENGHSGGFSQVCNSYYDIVEFVKKILTSYDIDMNC